MSDQENDKIYEAAYEDFYDLYFTSDSFASMVDGLVYEFCDEWTRCGTALKAIFHALWENDCGLLCQDKRTAVEAYIMYKKTMKVLGEQKN
jgi:hypothetical protein